MKVARLTKPARQARASSTSTEGQLIRWSRSIARLEREQRELKRRLAEVRDQLTLARRTLKALAQDAAARRPDSPPLRVFGEGQD